MSRTRQGLQRRAGRRGQALVEVAVFGTIFLMIVGALISYGLRFDYNQRAQQQAFRRALKIASDQDLGGGAYMLMEDRFIPDPTDPFGIGSSTPIMATADIVRTHQLDARAGSSADPDDLPTLVMDVQLGWTNDPSAPQPVMQRYVYRNAGFRYETRGSGYTEDQIDKYKYIYGDALGQNQYEYAIGTGPMGMPLMETRYGTVRIIDACSGHIVDYNTCYEQAVMLVDEDYCRTTCQRNSRGTDVNCTNICAQVLNRPNQNDQGFNASEGGPWYAANADASAGYWEFPVLDELFGRDPSGTGTVGPAPEGLSPDVTNDVRRDRSINRLETTNRIVTQQSASMHEQVTRNMVVHDNINVQGEEFVRPTAQAYAGNVVSVPMVSDVRVDINETWSTDKHTY